MKYRPILLLGLLWIGLAGCTARVQPVQTSQTDLVGMDAHNSTGQTFVARYDGLSGVQVYLSPEQPGDGELWLRLRSDPSAEQDIAAAVMPLSQVTEARTYLFNFQPLPDSNKQYYYALYEIVGQGSLGVGASSGSTYLDGAMYQQGSPRDGQLSFALVYDPIRQVIGLAEELIRWAGVLGIVGLLLIIPGWALFGWLWRGWEKLSWAEKLGLSAGFSLPFYFLLLLYTDWVGLHLGAGYAWGGVILGLAGLIWRGLRRNRLREGWATLKQAVKQPGRALHERLPELVLLILIGLILLTRWWAIREIEAPMWGDAVQHTFIAQLILDQGGLFQSWEPYAPYGSFGNQFGFPAAAALLAWISGMDAPQAVLWMGQAINVLTILALYPLALRIAKGGHWAGVGAVLVAGLWSDMPAFYFNWGRYAQLVGQVSLPVLLWMTWDIIEDAHASVNTRGLRWLPWVKLCLAGTVLSGMVMAQYRTPFFYLTFLLACLVGWWIPAWKLDLRRWLKAGLSVGLVILIGIVLFLPWGARMLASNVREVATTGASREALWASVQEDFQGWRTVTQYAPLAMIIGALLGWLWGLVRKAWPVIGLGLWVAWLASVYSWSALGVPGAQQVPTFAVLISLYVPAGLLIGWLVGQLATLLKRWLLAQVLLALIMVIAGLGLAWEQRTIAVPEVYAMVTRPDMRAMSWIREHTEPDARFLVEGFRAFYNTSAVGSDAGWWLPLLAGRANTMPPLYALSSEVPLEEGYSAQVVALMAALETTPLNTPEGVALLCEQEISHVYIGQQQGMVGLGWLNQSYTPEELLYQPYYELVYHQDRVYIFTVETGACDE